MKRVLLLNNVPAPYFDPLFELLGRRSGWALTVCYTSAWNRDVGWNEASPAAGAAHRTVILDRVWPALTRSLGPSPAAALALLGMLWRERPEYLICYGYTLAPQAAALMWAMVTAARFAVIGDANYFTDRTAGGKRWLKRAWLRLVSRRAAALIAIGTANRMFWESYGAKPRQVFDARFAVDNDYYSRECERRREEAAGLRARLGLDGKVIFLFVGRLVKRKNVDLLIQAFQQLGDERAAVLVAGTGDQQPALARQAGGHPRVVFAGLVTPAQLPTYYAMADVLVLPAAGEPWGLVVNEAMAAGLAVIAHRHCGAAVDLVGPDNGILLEGFEPDELARAMREMLNDPSKRGSMKHNSMEKIKYWSIEAAVCGIIRAVEESATPDAPETTGSTSCS